MTDIQRDCNGRPLVPGCLVYLMGGTVSGGHSRQGEYIGPAPGKIMHKGVYYKLSPDYSDVRLPEGKGAWRCHKLLRIDERPEPDWMENWRREPKTTEYVDSEVYEGGAHEAG